MVRCRAALGSMIGAAIMYPAAVSARAPDEYAANAVTAIQTLHANWYNVQTGIWDDAWWNSGNMLTMLADFAALRLDQANEINIGGYMRHTFVNAQKTMVTTSKTFTAEGMVSSVYCLAGRDDDGGCLARRGLLGKRGFDDFINEFYDDEAWWALGLIRAYDVTRDGAYLEAAVRIFDDLQTGLGGPCGGGIYWNKERRYVNAITNELYLSVTASLANRITEERDHYLGIATAHWEWFRNSGMINQDGLINDGLDDSCGNNGLQTWTYNQGVVLGGLAELWRATGDNSLLDEGKRIARAAIGALTGGDDAVLIETDRCELVDGNCGRDGAQFKGVFIRNLRYLHEVAPEDEFRDYIMHNADVIWEKNRDELGRMGVSWDGPVVAASGMSHSSAMDAIIAAVAVA